MKIKSDFTCDDSHAGFARCASGQAINITGPKIEYCGHYGNPRLELERSDIGEHESNECLSKYKINEIANKLLIFAKQ